MKDESRGATLEVVVSRMKTVQSSLVRSSENPDSVLPMRFVAVSATIPNADDVSISMECIYIFIKQILFISPSLLHTHIFFCSFPPSLRACACAHTHWHT